MKWGRVLRRRRRVLGGRRTVVMGRAVQVALSPGASWKPSTQSTQTFGSTALLRKQVLVFRVRLSSQSLSILASKRQNRRKGSKRTQTTMTLPEKTPSSEQKSSLLKTEKSVKRNWKAKAANNIKIWLYSRQIGRELPANIRSGRRRKWQFREKNQ